MALHQRPDLLHAAPGPFVVPADIINGRKTLYALQQALHCRELLPVFRKIPGQGDQVRLLPARKFYQPLVVPAQLRSVQVGEMHDPEAVQLLRELLRLHAVLRKLNVILAVADDAHRRQQCGRRGSHVPYE